MSDQPPLLGLIERLKLTPDLGEAKAILIGAEILDALTDLCEDNEKQYKDFLEELTNAVGKALRDHVNRLVRVRLNQENRDAAERIIPGISKLNLHKVKDVYVNSFSNIVALVEHLCEGKLCSDIFTHRLYFRELPNWAKWQKPPTPGPLGWTLFDDVYFGAMMETISQKGVITAFNNKNLLRMALMYKTKEKHSVDYYQETFNRLPEWDGVFRLNTWAETYLHAVIENETERRLIRAFCRKFIISMMYRCYNPPCNIRGTLILEGAQGIGKSRFVKMLGAPFAGELTGKKLDLHGGTANDIQGKMVMEIAEFDAMTRFNDTSAMKEFLTRVIDTYTKKYIADAGDFARRCVMIATVNPKQIGYLNDASGNTRYWPINCGDQMIDVDGFALVRDQIFAEAKVAYQKGLDIEPYWLNAEEDVIHSAYVAGREMESTELDVVMRFLADNESHVRTNGLRLGDLEQYWSGGRRPGDKGVAAALEQCGLISKRIYVGKIQQRVWLYKGTEEDVKRNLNAENKGNNIVPFRKPDF